MGWNSPEERFAEAERRIEAARVAGSTSLDLSDLRLPELPESLGQLWELWLLMGDPPFPEELLRDLLNSLPKLEELYSDSVPGEKKPDDLDCDGFENLIPKLKSRWAGPVLGRKTWI